MRTTNRFTRGSGCYKCSCCNKLTRSTGRGDNEHARLCVECFDLGGLDNSLDDGAMTVNEVRDAIGNTFTRRPELTGLFPRLAKVADGTYLTAHGFVNYDLDAVPYGC